MDEQSRSIRVTIGIPTYNRLKYLKEAVSSARAQTYANLEILIFQNPHPDPAVTGAITEYCRTIIANDPRARHRLNPNDIGAPANFNAIADSATGEYLLLIGDDDRLLPKTIETMVNAIDSDTSMVFANHYVIDADGALLNKKSVQLTRKYCRNLIPRGRVVKPQIVAWQQAPCIQSSLIRTSDFRRIRFREHIDVPDIEFFILLSRESGSFVFLPDYLAQTRLHPDSVTGRGFRGLPGLVDNLQSLPVTPDVEPYKRKVLATLIMGAISTCLLNGEVDRARVLLRSRYFPGAVRSGTKGIVMSVCALLPGGLGASSYRLFRAIRHLKFRQPVTQWA